MRKRAVLILIALSLMLSMSACVSVFASSYSYVTEYSDDIESVGGASGAEIKNYSQLKNAINDIVNSGQTAGELSFSGYTGSVRDDMAAACYEVKTQTPMGAYAVEELNYELNRIVSYYTAEISISYRRSIQEIEAVVMLNGVSSLRSYVTEAVNGHSDKLVLRIFSSIVNEEYIKDIVSSAYFNNPLVSAREPYTGVTGYPTEGVNKIYEIELDYGMDANELTELRDKLDSRIDVLCKNVTAKETWRCALELAQALSASFREADSGEGAADTVSGALLEGRASSMGAALAYKVLCDEMGIECIVVRGRLGTLGTQDHYWNIIGIDGDYYHVDVSRLDSAGAERAFLLDDVRAWGTYMWESDSYPVCDGPLDYTELSAPVPEETEPPVDSPEPSETVSPEQGPEPTEAVPPEPSESVEPTTSPEITESPEPTDTDEKTDDASTVEPTDPVRSSVIAKNHVNN